MYRFATCHVFEAEAATAPLGPETSTGLSREKMFDSSAQSARYRRQMLKLTSTSRSDSEKDAVESAS